MGATCNEIEATNETGDCLRPGDFVRFVYEAGEWVMVRAELPGVDQPKLGVQWMLATLAVAILTVCGLIVLGVAICELCK